MQVWSRPSEVRRTVGAGTPCRPASIWNRPTSSAAPSGKSAKVTLTAQTPRGAGQPPDLTLLTAGDRSGEVDHLAERVRRRDRRDRSPTPPTQSASLSAQRQDGEHVCHCPRTGHHRHGRARRPAAAGPGHRGRGAGRAPPSGAGGAGHRVGEVGGLLGGHRGPAGGRRRADAGRLPAARPDARPDRRGRPGRAAGGHGELDQRRRLGRGADRAAGGPARRAADLARTAVQPGLRPPAARPARRASGCW